MVKLCDIPPSHRRVETVRPGFFCGDTDELKCPDDKVWSDAKALAAWLKRRSSGAVGFRRFVYDPEDGKKYLDPGWVYYRGTVIPQKDVLSGKAEKAYPNLPVTDTLKSNLECNDWDCLWLETYRKAWPFERDEDVFVEPE